MDGRPQTGRLADSLPDPYLLANLYQRLAGGSRMHRHGDDHLGGLLFERRNRLAVGGALMVVGVNAAIELL